MLIAPSYRESRGRRERPLQRNNQSKNSESPDEQRRIFLAITDSVPYRAAASVDSAWRCDRHPTFYPGPSGNAPGWRPTLRGGPEDTLHTCENQVAALCEPPAKFSGPAATDDDDDDGGGSTDTERSVCMTNAFGLDDYRLAVFRQRRSEDSLGGMPQPDDLLLGWHFRRACRSEAHGGPPNCHPTVASLDTEESFEP
ncbi:hypothetical protein CSOJ01_08396 [Colletotrichum sojae]|uniref:Uncharacterized protein n=1 Tax=Colletotrichum sojae TaxID=2175907 RepID=A0A8H6J5Z2_9PEZI|nr:hypothetical protein CSOJ01_08396 [Colletotrichum sojae]